MFENVDGKPFTDVSSELGKDFLRIGHQRGSAFVDVNNDGFPDLVVTSLNEPPRIMLNSADNGYHWVLVETRGRKSNRDGIGAVLKLTTESGRTLYNHNERRVHVGQRPRVHFGIGAEKKVKSLEIKWPSGAVQVVTDVGIDRILKIEEAAAGRPSAR